FLAEDGIRDFHVTGVQTCALPILLDHESLISTLKQMHTLTEYFQALGTSKILDIQPVRDASHYIDLKINSLMGIENFGLIHNIILLFIITYLLFKISTYYQLKSKIYLASIFLIHPAIFHVFVEETSRKHILSFLFSL